MLIKLKNVSYVYGPDQGVKAVKDVDLEIREKEFIGLVGHTGSGKSTLVQLLNGLIKPSEGSVIIDGINTREKKKSLQGIRRKIGLVFQYPEHQLFEETVYNDIAFGPRNLELDENKVELRVKESLELLGLAYSGFKNRSPFNLSGGQQRKIAIAGVLAMKPQVLILDEPTAGLDPRGREQLLKLLKLLHKDHEMTIVLISHRMEEVARLSNRVIVMSRGEVKFDAPPERVFSKVDDLKKLGLDLPEITEILWRLKKNGYKVRTDIFTLNEAIREIVAELRGSNIC